jgi:hypothetical protein
VLVEELIGQVGAGLKSQALRKNERVVAVEEEVFELLSQPSASCY